MKHIDYVCPGGHDDGGWSCMFCAGGLFSCSVCGSFEGATTTHCPGYNMYAEYGDRIYAGEIDFRDGKWREGECSRHTPAYWSTPAGLAEIETFTNKHP
ncbi:hypothetical protein [Amycolatopsis sp. TNS106]|uniref:hypothetical protein n=1 Tax=Amycolatopsis sp. TNS106 TaxID=2861750 RepID=UPI001C56986B|nr:hypothetical protein [Amycolatopsis sp. TNS106]